MEDNKNAPDAMKLALMETDDYGPHCANTSTDNRGHVVATCTRVADHPGDIHIDIHSGRSWGRRWT